MDTSQPDLWTQTSLSKPNDDQGRSRKYNCQYRTVSLLTGLDTKKRNSLNNVHPRAASIVSTTSEFPDGQTDLPPPSTHAEWTEKNSFGSTSGIESGFLQGVKKPGGTETICGPRLMPWPCDSNEFQPAVNAEFSSSTPPLTTITHSIFITTSPLEESIPARLSGSITPSETMEYSSSTLSISAHPSASGATQSTPSSMSYERTSSSTASYLSPPPTPCPAASAQLASTTLNSSLQVLSSSRIAPASSSASFGSNSSQFSRNTGVIIGVLGGVIFLLLVVLFLRFRRQKIAQYARRQGNDAEQPNPSSSGSVSPLIYRYQTTQNQSDRQSVTSSSFEHLAHYEGDGSVAEIQTSDDNSVLARQRRDAIISILDSESSIGIPLDILSRSHESQHALGVETVDGVAF